MDAQYYFMKLDLWKKARELNVLIYKTTALYPKSEQFGLQSQIRRCSVSVASNIAEGTSRKSGKEQARFSEIAYGSLVELINQLILSNDLKYGSDEAFENLSNLIADISRMGSGLRKTQLQR